MEFLPERKFKTKAICGLNKNELFNKLISSIQNDRLKSAIEATTYIHYSGYDQEWWDTIFNIILKHIHINLYGHYQDIEKYYSYYLEQKQNNQAINTNRTIGWHMCLITTLLTILDKTPILTRQQVKYLPFMQFSLHEGTTRPTKLRIIRENMTNCISDAVETKDFQELIQLTHYVLREDYGHNKYVPIFIEKIIEHTSIHKCHELNALKNLYPHINGNKRYLTVLVIAYIHYHEYVTKTELGKFEKQSEYYYGKTLERIKLYYLRLESEKQNKLKLLENSLKQEEKRREQNRYNELTSKNLEEHNQYNSQSPPLSPPQVKDMSSYQQRSEPINIDSAQNYVREEEPFIFEPRYEKMDNNHTENIFKFDTTESEPSPPELQYTSQSYQPTPEPEYNYQPEPEPEPESEQDPKPEQYSGKKPVIKIIKM